MINDDTEIVPVIRRALADRIGAERYELWFAKTAQFRVLPDRLIVTVPNVFQQDWLRKNFRGPLEETVREALGPTATVTFEVDTQLAAAHVTETKQEVQRSLLDLVPSDESAEPARLRIVRTEQAAPERTSRSQPVTAGRRSPDFDGFVVGSTNRLAYVSALGVSERLGSISPLLIHGPTGVGKTHLLEAIGVAARRQHADLRLAYLTAEQFTTEFLDALQGRGLPSFRRKFRDLHLLLIDDVQFLAGKRATIEEAVHTIDVLQRDGRQVVFAADRPTTGLGALGAEFCTRLSGGLVCKIEAPDMATRLGIVERISARMGLTLPEDVRQFVATHFSAHARELAGALKRLLVAVRAYERPMDLCLAEEALDELIRGRRKSVRLADIEKAICDLFGLETDALQSPRKGKEVSHPRMLAMWLARKYTRAALSEIGGYFGGRSHSTVISAHKKVDGWIRSNEPLRLHGRPCAFDEAVRKVEATLLAAGA